MYFCSPSIAVLVVSSILIRPLPPSFLDMYSLSTLLLRCKALCIVIIFLVLRSKAKSSSLFQSRKGAEYRMTATAHVLIALIKLWPLTFVTASIHNRAQIKQADKTKYLGVIVDDTLGWEE